MVDWFSVDVEARAPGDAAEVVTDEAIEAFMALVEPHDGVVGGGQEWRSWDARFGVEAADAAEASEAGARLVRSLAARAGLPDWPLVKLEATREDVFDEELRRDG